jgi:signal transduction histidine kinase
MSHFETFLLLDESSDAEKEKTLLDVYAYSKDHSSLVNQVGYGKKLYEHYQETKQFRKAQTLLYELLTTAKASGNGVYTLGITQALYDNSKAIGDLSLALVYLEDYNALHDSLLSVENTRRIAELNIRFETAQKDHEIEQQKIRLEQARRNRNFFVMVALLLTALAVTVFFYFRSRTRSAQRITARDKVIHRQETEKLIKEKEVAQLTATLETQERERNRIARDLHDGLGSTMSGISSQIEYLKAQPAIHENVKDHLSHLKDLVKDVSSELRRTSYELMPAKLLRQGLEPAIRDLCLNLLVKKGIEPSLEINADLSTLHPEQQLTLYRIIQELLNNIVKHAEARNVLIQFTRFENELSLVVEDDGKGFDVEAKKQDGGLGLGSLGSRVSLLKGFLDIASTAGEGTTVTVNFNL